MRISVEVWMTYTQFQFLLAASSMKTQSFFNIKNQKHKLNDIRLRNLQVDGTINAIYFYCMYTVLMMVLNLLRAAEIHFSSWLITLNRISNYRYSEIIFIYIICWDLTRTTVRKIPFLYCNWLQLLFVFVSAHDMFIYQF